MSAVALMSNIEPPSARNKMCTHAKIDSATMGLPDVWKDHGKIYQKTCVTEMWNVKWLKCEMKWLTCKMTEI